MFWSKWKQSDMTGSFYCNRQSALMFSAGAGSATRLYLAPVLLFVLETIRLATSYLSSTLLYFSNLSNH
jgi:hypothetical protein